MKRKSLIFMVVSMFLILSLSGCSKKNEEFKIGSPNKVDGVCEYNIRGIYETQKVQPSVPIGMYRYYKTTNNKNSLIDLEMYLTNLTDSSKKVNELVACKFKVGGKEYKSYDILENDNGSSIEMDGKIDASKSSVVHCAVEVPSDKVNDELKVILTVNEKDYEKTISLKDMKVEKTYIKKDEEVKNKDVSQIKINKIYYTDKLEPSKKSGFYRYYKPRESGNTLLVLKMDVKNLGKEDLEVSKLLGAKPVPDKYSKYAGIKLLEEDGTFVESGVIKPSKEATVYCLLELQKEAKDDKDVEVQINYGGSKYFVKDLK